MIQESQISHNKRLNQLPVQETTVNLQLIDSDSQVNDRIRLMDCVDVSSLIRLENWIC